VKDHHASYYPGGKELVLKLVYDRASGRLLGGQALGEEGVEKRIDALAAALHGKMTLEDLAEIDFAYSPPFSSANDPLNIAAFAGLNDLSGYAPLVCAEEARKLLAAPGAAGARADTTAARPVLLDVRNLNEYETSHVRGTLHIPVDELRFRLDEVPRDAAIMVHCRSGFRSHLALRILKENGWQNVRNVTGGYVAMTALGGFDIEE
jgi:rhodanese-related sulfurtransferase